MVGTNVIAPGRLEVSTKAKWSEENEGKTEVALDRNLQSSGFQIAEPDDNDELSGGKEVFLEGLLASYQNYLEERTGHQLGFPCTLGEEYGRLLKLVPFSINNLGDPFVESNYGLHSKQFEVGVLDWFARLWGLDKNEYWGYVTSCGTEGNLHGILTGRELLPEGVLYASRESHYSVFKAARMFQIDCVKVDTLVSGQIDCSDLERKLLQNKSRPAIVNLNIGTTVKAAVDDLDLTIKILETSGFKDRFYIHCDGALLGAMLPFIERAPKLTFKKPIGSVCVSGHKFAGCPLPCGVHITRKSYINVHSQNLEWISSKDTTIMGSRSGHAALFLWYALNRRGYSGFRKEVGRCLLNARLLKTRLSTAGIGAMLNEFSNTVVFERPQDEDFVRKWQLLCEGNIAHVVVMPNVTVEQLCVFVDELVRRRRVWSRDGEIPPPCIAEEVGRENCACPSHFHRQ